MNILERYGSVDVDTAFQEVNASNGASQLSIYQFQEELGAKLRAGINTQNRKEFMQARKWGYYTLPQK